jgi:hypothetical protein
MHTNKERKQIKKQRTQDFLRGSAKAYVHGAHQHSIHSYQQKNNSEELYSFKFTNSY